MPTAEKAETIEQARDWYAKSSGVVFADYRGLKVKEMQSLRKDLRKKGAELHVLKNTLFRIVAGDDVASLAEAQHNGTTAYAFVFENESEIAKTLLDYARVSKKIVVKGGLFGGRGLSVKELEALSELPSRDVLIAQVIGAIAAPLTTLVGTIEALYADPIRVIGAVADKVAEGSPIPVKEDATAAEATSEAPTAEAVTPEIAAPEATVTEAPEAEAASAPESSAPESSAPENAAPENAAPETPTAEAE